MSSGIGGVTRFSGGAMLATWLLGGCLATAQSVDELDRPTQRAFEEGEALFNNLQQTEALELFSQVIDGLMPTARAGTLSEAQRDVLLQSLSYRARIGFNVGETDIVDGDLDTVIRLHPGFLCAPRLVSPGLVQACDELRAELVGQLELVVNPPDAAVQVDGRPVSPDVGPIEIIAGSHVVSVNRDGYAGERLTVEVEPGSSSSVYEVDLERVSAVLRVLTRPAGATVHVNTIQYGPTEGTAEPGPFRPSVIEGYPLEDFSDELVVPGLRPGIVSVVVTLDGYRAIRSELDLAEPADYPAHFVLERAEGIVAFDGILEGSTVEVSRRGEAGMAAVTLDSGRVVLPIGVYDVAITHPDAGFYQDTATVVDGQEYLVPVRLRPSVSVLGILGEDRVGRDALIRTLGNAFDDIESWTFQDRTASGGALLADAGLTVARLRGQANPRVVQDDPIDWDAVQRSSAREAQSSVYLVGVLDNDLSATAADLWMWRAAPGPVLPSRVRVALSGDGLDVTSWVQRDFAEVALRHPWLGALLVDVEAEAGPFVVDVTAGGPADQAGLVSGDVVVSVNGFAPDGVASLHRMLATGNPVTLGVDRDNMQGEVVVTAGDSPRVLVDGAAELAYPAVAVGLAASRARQPAGPANWVWELNEAATRLQAGDLAGALEVLRRSEPLAPAGAGVGRGTLYYWLGMAYTIAGPEFRAQAEQSFERAVEDADARLQDHDGPWVAPRARARLAWLRGGVPGSR